MKTVNCTGLRQCEKQNHTSKGDQPKWFIDNYWYKADYMGYESLAETVVSDLLEKSNTRNFVNYEPVIIKTDKNESVGCASKNFKHEQEMLVTLEKLHRAYKGIGLAQQLAEIYDIKERIKYTVDFVTETTGIENFADYITLMLEIDAFFLNEDRHTNNIAVIRNEKTKEFKLCPVFDNGLSLLSDINDYPFNEDIYKLIDRVKAKPFDTSFDEQLDAAEELYGIKLHFNFTRIDIENEFEKLNGIFSENTVSRVKKIILEQKRRYGIYF